MPSAYQTPRLTQAPQTRAALHPSVAASTIRRHAPLLLTGTRVVTCARFSFRTGRPVAAPDFTGARPTLIGRARAVGYSRTVSASVLRGPRRQGIGYFVIPVPRNGVCAGATLILEAD